MATKRRPDSLAAIDGEDCGPDVGESSLCVCRNAVRRCYAGMTESGAPAKVALEAAIRGSIATTTRRATTHLSRETGEGGVLQRDEARDSSLGRRVRTRAQRRADGPRHGGPGGDRPMGTEPGGRPDAQKKGQ